MSQENVELAYRSVDAFNRRDLDAFLGFNDPDVVFTPRLLELEGGGPYRGHDGIQSWWENVLTVVPDFSVEIDEVRDLGDVTVGRVRVRGHGTGSEVPFEQPIWQVAKWRRKKCVWWQSFPSENDALEAVGLSE